MEKQLISQILKTIKIPILICILTIFTSCIENKGLIVKPKESIVYFPNKNYIISSLEIISDCDKNYSEYLEYQTSDSLYTINLNALQKIDDFKVKCDSVFIKLDAIDISSNSIFEFWFYLDFTSDVEFEVKYNRY